MDQPPQTKPLPVKHFSEQSIERARKIEAYIKAGLELIRKGQYEEAEKYFANPIKAKEVTGEKIGWGEVQSISSLLSRKELENALYRIATKSRPDELPTYMCKNGYDGKKMENMPELYDPELVREFRYEVSLIFAEEWIHRLQHLTGIPAAGEEDKEVDIAAYLDKEGFYLSDHFVTRYARRENWFVKKHPEREKSIREFKAA